jgi:hypothetical protein
MTTQNPTAAQILRARIKRDTLYLAELQAETAATTASLNEATAALAALVRRDPSAADDPPL